MGFGMQDTLQQRLDFVGLGEGVAARLAPIADSAMVHLETALQRFAAHASATPNAARFMYGRERIAGEGGGPAAQWRALLSGQIGRSFAETAMRTGQRHARLGVDPRWHAGSQAIVLDVLIRGIVEDGMAAALKPRRGPLGLLGAGDPAASARVADAMAAGLSTLASAVLLDLDLTYAGYAEKLRLDAELKLEGEQARLRLVLDQAGRLLAAAAEGRRDETLLVSADPDLAPLRAGAEKLADRVIGLVEDLATAGEAAEALAAEVLSAGEVLVSERAGQIEDARTLSEVLGEQAPAAAALSNGLGELARHGKAVSRKVGKGRRDLEASRLALDAAARQPDVAEGADGLSQAANLLVARLATMNGLPQGNALEADMRALAFGLAQLAGQVRKGQEATTRLGRDAATALETAGRLLERLGGDLAAELGVMGGLERHGVQLAAGLARSHAIACALRDDLSADAEQGAAVRETIRQALEGAGALVELAATMDGADETPPVPEGSATYPLPEQAAMAAHWHAV